MIETPETGLVARYHFLWWNQHARGEESGRKARPACLVVPLGGAGGTVVLFPLTTQQPEASRKALAVPATERRRLRLPGNLQSWVLLDELNQDVWPGSLNFEPVGRDPLRFSYGSFSPAFMRLVLATMRDAIKERRMRMIPRVSD